MLISVVVPTYRRPHLLPDALDSLAAQTHTDLEVLVCDNDADPAVEALVAGYGPRFRWCPRPINLGLLASVQQGFTEARGELLAGLDDDDVFRPECLERLAAPLERDPSLVLSFADYRRVSLSGTPLPPHEAGPSPCAGLVEGRQTEPARLVVGAAVGLCPSLVRRGVVDWNAIPAAVATAYDVHVPLEAARVGSFWYVDEVLADIRMHAGQDTARFLLAQQRGTLASLELARTRLPLDQQPALAAGIRLKTLAVYRLALEAGRPEEARDVARGAHAGGLGVAAHALVALDLLPPRVRLALVRAAERRRRARRQLAPQPAAQVSAGPAPR